MIRVERVRVGDVLRLERFPVETSPTEEYVAIGVRSFGRGLFHYEPAPGNKLGSLRFFGLRPGRLVVSNIKGWEGAVAFSTEADAGCIASNRFLVYDAADHRVDINWTRWFFLSEPGNALIQRASPGSADRNRTLAVKRFEDIVIPLPPIEQQRRVAARLDEASVKTNRISELAGRSVELSRAFASAWASASHLSVEEKRLRGWRRVALRDFLTQSNEKERVALDGSYPNLGIYSFGRGLFEKAPIEGNKTSAISLFRVRSGQFIYSRLFAFEGAYATVPERFDGYFVSNEFPSFDTDTERLDASWLSSYLRSPERWSGLAVQSTGLGVRRQRVPVESVLAYEVMLPPVAEQRAMVRAIQQVDAIRARRATSAAPTGAIVPSVLNQEFAVLK